MVEVVGEGNPTVEGRAARAVPSFGILRGDVADHGEDNSTKKNLMIDRRSLRRPRRTDWFDERVRFYASSTQTQQLEETHELGWGTSFWRFFFAVHRSTNQMSLRMPCTRCPVHVVESKRLSRFRHHYSHPPHRS